METSERYNFHSAHSKPLTPRPFSRSRTWSLHGLLRSGSRQSTWKALPSPTVAARFCALASRWRHADVLVDRRGVLGPIRGVGGGAPRAQSRLTWDADKAHTNGRFQQAVYARPSDADQPTARRRSPVHGPAPRWPLKLALARKQPKQNASSARPESWLPNVERKRFNVPDPRRFGGLSSHHFMQKASATDFGWSAEAKWLTLRWGASVSSST